MIIFKNRIYFNCNIFIENKFTVWTPDEDFHPFTETESYDVLFEFNSIEEIEGDFDFDIQEAFNEAIMALSFVAERNLNKLFVLTHLFEKESMVGMLKVFEKEYERKAPKNILLNIFDIK